MSGNQAQLQARLDTIEDMIAKGVTEMQQGDERVKFRSLNEMQRIKRDLKILLGQSPAKRRMLYPRTSAGFRYWRAALTAFCRGSLQAPHCDGKQLRRSLSCCRIVARCARRRPAMRRSAVGGVRAISRRIRKTRSAPCRVRVGHWPTLRETCCETILVWFGPTISLPDTRSGLEFGLLSK